MKPKLIAQPSFVPSDDTEAGNGPELPEDRVPDGLSPEARMVRAVYVHERTQHENARDGLIGQYQVPKRFDGISAKTRGGKVVEKGVKSAWQRVADFCIEHSINPRAYIAAIFAAHGVTKKAWPNPEYFYGQAALDRWNELKREQERMVELSARIETEAAAKKMNYYRAIGFNRRRAYRTTLVDDSLNISPLFRYCVAVDCGYYDIRDHFYGQAVMQFMRYDDYYRRYWKTLLPKGFAAQAKADFERILRRNHDEEA